MAAENVNNTEEEKVSVGSFSFTISPGASNRITEQIGEILEAQVILRGSKNLGFGTVTFTTASENGAAEGDIQGTARLERAGRGGGRAKTSRGRGKTGGRARRSADDPSALDDPSATSEQAAANGQTSVKAVAEGLQNMAVGDKDSAAGGTVEHAAAEAAKSAAGRGGRAKRGRGRGAANAKPRERRERGEPSKTLVYLRNIPYAMTEEKLTELVSSVTSFKVQSISLPLHKFGAHKGNRRGFGFITASNEEEQTKLIEALDGHELSSAGDLDTSTAQEAAEKTQGADSAEVEGSKTGERKFKLVARKGYENEEKNAEKEEGDNAAGEQEASATPAA